MPFGSSSTWPLIRSSLPSRANFLNSAGNDTPGCNLTITRVVDRGFRPSARWVSSPSSLYSLTDLLLTPGVLLAPFDRSLAAAVLGARQAAIRNRAKAVRLGPHTAFRLQK